MSNSLFPQFVIAIKNDTRVKGKAKKYPYVGACVYGLSSLKNGTPVYQNLGFDNSPNRRSYALAIRDANELSKTYNNAPVIAWVRHNTLASNVLKELEPQLECIIPSLVEVLKAS